MTKASVTRIGRNKDRDHDIASLKKLFVTLALRLKDVEDKLGIETVEVPSVSEKKA